MVLFKWSKATEHVLMFTRMIRKMSAKFGYMQNVFRLMHTTFLMLVDTQSLKFLYLEISETLSILTL